MNTITKELESNELSIVVMESGIEKSKAELITSTLGSFFNKAKEWNNTISALVINDISETGKMKMAREGRLTLKNMRIECKKLVEEKRQSVKNRMADDILEDKLWLKSFQMVEATYKNLEGKLEEKEKFAERKEAERLDQIEKERLSKLLPLSEFCSIESMDLKRMNEDDFNEKLDKASRLSELDRKEKEQIEKDKIAKEKADVLRNERKQLLIPIWEFVPSKNREDDFATLTEAEFKDRYEYSLNLKKENDAKIEAQRLENEKLKSEAETNAKVEAKRIAKEIADAKERELKEKAAKDAQEAVLRKEREALEKVEAELKASKDAELKKIKDADAKAKSEKAAQEKSLLAPDKIKLENLANEIVKITLPELKSDEAKEVLKKVQILLNKTSKYIKEESVKL